MTIVANPRTAHHSTRSPAAHEVAPSPCDLVDAVAFRALARQLISDTGLPWRALARAAGVDPSIMAQLLMGVNGHEIRMLPRRDAERLLGLTRERLERLRREPAPCSAVRMMAWRLGLEGIGVDRLAGFLAMSGHDLRQLMAGANVWCSRWSMLRAEAACQAWGIDPDALLRPARGQWTQ